MDSPRRKRAKYGHTCYVCCKEVTHIRRHINRVHIPWYMSPAYACVDCQSAGDLVDLERFHGNHRRFHGDLLRAWFLLVNGFLLFICRGLGLSTLNDLLGYVVTEQLLCPQAPRSRFLDEELFFIREYDQLAGLEPNEHPNASAPTRISELLHFQNVARMLSRVNTEAVPHFRHTLMYANPDGSSPPAGYPRVLNSVIDGHFHLDKLIGDTRKTFKELEIRANPTVNLIHAVANFVYPRKWGLITELMSMDSRLSFSLGIHPHLLLLNNVESMFRRLCDEIKKRPAVKAVGEVGLDFTTNCRCRGAPHDKMVCREGKMEAQRIFLEKALKLAHDLDKPVIIHCRDNGDGSAAKGVLRALTSLGLTTLKVHRHCFIGSVQELEEWSNQLPNCYFSISRLSLTDDATKEALWMSDHNRLLFETDSPYLPFPGDTGHGPWRVGEVAQAVSLLLGEPIHELVKNSNENLRKLYNLSW